MYVLFRLMNAHKEFLLSSIPASGRKQPLLPRLLLICSLLFGSFCLEGQTTAILQHPRISPEPAILALAQKAYPTIYDLAEAALFFSAPSAERQLKAMLNLEAILAKARNIGLESKDSYALGEELMQLLHSNVLRSYHEQTTSLDAALLEGRYNCVSSSILFLLLARAAGLEAWGVTTIDHSFISVRLPDGRTVDAETTNPYGWDPGSRKDFQDSKGLTAGFRYVPPGNYLARQDVSDRALVSLVAQNLATLEERRQRWGPALSLIVDAYAWWPEPNMYDYLMARVGNYIGSLVNRRQWSAALDFFSQIGKAYQLSEQLHSLRNLIMRGSLADSLQSQPLERSEAAIMAAMAEGWLEPTEQHEMILFVYSREAEQLSRAGKWRDAAELLKTGRLRWPQIEGLVRAEQQAFNNWIYDIHNSFARLFNSRRFEEAGHLLARALELAPDNQLLLENLRQLEAMTNR